MTEDNSQKPRMGTLGQRVSRSEKRHADKDKRKKAKRNWDRKYNIALTITIGLFLIYAFYNQRNRNDAMLNFGTTTGTVIAISNISGYHIVPADISYKWTMHGKSMTGKAAKQELRAHVGDCILIKYSLSNPNYNEPVYSAGVIPCPNTPRAPTSLPAQP